MTGLYLITGFLGAGKTTFLKNLLAQLSGHKLRVIVNEFGSEGIDGALLRGSGAVVEEIYSGSIFCSCRLDQFEETLKKVYLEAPELILVEPSGLSDPTQIEAVLKQTDGLGGLSYMGGICLVDAVNFKKVLSTARVSRKQVMVSDLVLLNKADLYPKRRLTKPRRLSGS
jgi:G3E family GTPase